MTVYSKEDIVLTAAPRKILIIKPSSLGDIIHSLPFLHSVKERYPETKVDWVVARGLHPLLENNPLINRLWIINKDKWLSPSYLKNTVREIIGLYRGLGRENYDVAVDLSGLLRSGIMAYASKAEIRLGFAESDEGSPFFYTHKIQSGTELHAIDRNLTLAKVMGCNTDDIRYSFPPCVPSPAILRDLPPEYAVMAPSAGKEANRWPAARFGELAARLPLPTVLISGASDAHLVQEALNSAEGKAVSLAGRTGLLDLVAVIRKAKFFVSNDTGPMHIAAALNVPVFAIFGPANPVRTGPYGKIHTIIQEDLPCAPCYRWKPCDHWQCMEDLTVEKVYRIITGKIVENP